MDFVPDEVWHLIMNFLSPAQLCRCMEVCSKWKRLCNDNRLWRHIELDCTEPLWVRRLEQATVRHPNVRSVSLYGNNNIYNPPASTSRCSTPEDRPYTSFRITWDNLQNLRCLKLHFCHREVVDLLPAFLRSCPLLGVIACEGSRDFDLERHLLLDGRTYSELSFAHSPSVDDASVARVLSPQGGPLLSIATLRNLQALNLDGVPFLSDAGTLALLRLCPAGLRSLSLDGEHLTDATGCFVGEHLVSLAHLSVSFCDNFTDAVLSALCNLRDLHTLILKRGYNFTNEALTRLFGAIRAGCPERGGLTHLSLVEWRQLADVGAKMAAERFPTLTYLDLSWCWLLTDDCLESVAQNCKRIRTLKLVGLRGTTCASILCAPTRFLSHLDLTHCHLVNDADLEHFKRRKPHATVINYYGEEVS